MVRRLHLPQMLGGDCVLQLVIDAYSRKVVGRQFASHMRTTRVLDALRMALHQRAPRADVALASGRAAHSSSWPSLSTSPGSTTSVCTKLSATATPRDRGTLRCQRQANQTIK